jgi:hypothetical protein
MHNDEPWDMLSDKKIWARLNDADYEISADILRLMLIELFSRIKNLEYENNTLKVLLFEYELIDEKLYSEALSHVKEFFKEWDERKAKEIDFFSKSGISFVDWAAFTAKGKFDSNILSN